MLSHHIQELLVCNNCYKTLERTDILLICNKCKNKIVIRNGQYFCIPYDVKKSESALYSWKMRFKQNSTFYSLLIHIISPVYSRNLLKNFIRKNVSDKKICLNLGSGNSHYPNVFNVDLHPYPNVDVVSDLLHLPFKENSIDIIICNATLEHVKNDQSAVREMYRVLKKNGLIYCMYPFIQGFHASPHDYSRRTIRGLQELFKDFEMVQIQCTGGPTSGMLWILQEWFAIVLSFGFKPLHDLLYIIIMLVTFPIKYLDIIFIHHPYAHNISSGFIIIVKKS